MFLVAPFIGFMGFGGFLFSPAVGLVLIGLAWVLGITGFGLFIYGLVAKSDLEKAALMRPPVVINPQAQLPYPQPRASPERGA